MISVKTQVRSLGRIKTSLFTLHKASLHFITFLFHFLHHRSLGTIKKNNYFTIHYTSLHFTTRHYTSLHFTTFLFSLQFLHDFGEKHRSLARVKTTLITHFTKLHYTSLQIIHPSQCFTSPSFYSLFNSFMISVKNTGL